MGYRILTQRYQSVHENRIYSVNIHCGDSYPDTPPTIQFTSKVNIPCVDQRTGKVRTSYNEGECSRLTAARWMGPNYHVWHSGDGIILWRPS
jgi:ubiquitin-protein ligase